MLSRMDSLSSEDDFRIERKTEWNVPKVTSREESGDKSVSGKVPSSRTLFRGRDSPLQNEKEDPFHQHECLAASRPCDHLARPAEVADRLLLVRIPTDLQTGGLQMILLPVILIKLVLYG